MPCKLCLTISEYGEDDIIGSATLSGGTYTGSVGSHSFEAYWENTYGVCELVVLVDDEETRFEKCGYIDGVTCRSPTFEIEAPPAYGEDSGDIITVTVTEPLTLPHYQDESIRCKTLDVSFVVDDTGSMGATIAELKDNLTTLGATIAAATDSYQMSLITFNDAVTQDLAFSINNGTAFDSAVNALTASGGAGIPEASDYALKEAVEQTGWRYEGTNSKRIIILITDAPPGGLDDVEDVEDLQRLIDAATAAKDAGIILAAVNAGNAAASLQAAVTANGDEGRYISSVSDMIDRIEGLIDAECVTRPGCKYPYCGTCTCTQRKICFTMTGPDGCSVSKVIENETDYDGCDSPTWLIDETCGYFSIEGAISLERDEYTGECVLSVPGLDDPIEISECSPLAANWSIEDGYDTYDFSIRGTDCGECDPPDIEDQNCPCEFMPYCMRYTVFTHSGTVDCDETGSICHWPGTTWAAEDTSESKNALSVYCGQQGAGLPCADIFHTGGGLAVTFRGQGPQAPANTPGDETGGECGCDPFSLTVYFLNTVCGGVGDGLIGITFTR